VKKDKFQLFLEQSKFISPILNEAKLNQVIIDLKTRKWVFDITLSDVIEPEILLPFIQTLKSYFLVSRVHSGADVQLHYHSLSAFEEHAMSYFDYAVIQLSKEKARFMVLKNFKARYEHKEYILSVDQDSTYLQEYFKDIISLLETFGLKTTIKLEIIHTLTPTSKMIESSIKDQVNILEQKQEYAKQNVKKDNKKTFAKKAVHKQFPSRKFLWINIA